jgi:phosphatidylinositol dimannoside acyltransferase
MTAPAMSRAGQVRPAHRRGRARTSALVLGLRVLAWLLVRLPDRPLHRMAMSAGSGLYLLQRRRRGLVRENLRHVCGWLAAEGLANPATTAAARDEAALARLTRAAYGHYVRAYLESVIVERYARGRLADRISADDPQLASRVFGAPGDEHPPLLLVGLHFGAIEVPALWAVGHGLRLTSPMETLADPQLQAFIVGRRSASGLNLVPLAGAHRELSSRLAAGESVAVVADRVVGGSGARTQLFGRPARLPIGPAVLALETGLPAWAVAVRRTAPGEYRARLERIDLPAEGARRERLAAFMANQAAAFERLIADAPEQWWTLFFPIWETSRQVRG